MRKKQEKIRGGCGGKSEKLLDNPFHYIIKLNKVKVKGL